MANYHNEDEAVKKHLNYRWDTTKEWSLDEQSSHYLKTRWYIDRIPSNTSRILDVGCNTGGFGKVTLYLYPHIRVYGIEVTKKNVHWAIEYGTSVLYSKAEDMPFRHHFFDIVILSEILEHTFDPSKIITQVDRVLKPTGKILGSVPYIHSPVGFASKDEYHMREYGREDLKTLFSNFKIDFYDVYYHCETNERQRAQWLCFEAVR